MHKLTVALAGAALIAVPAFGQTPSGNAGQANSTDQAAKPAGGTTEAEAPSSGAPAAPKPAATEGTQPDTQSAPAKPTSDAPSPSH